MIKKIFLVLFCLSSTNVFALYNFRTPTGIFLSYRAMNSHRRNIKINDNTQTDTKNDKETDVDKEELNDDNTIKINDKEIINTTQEEMNEHNNHSAIHKSDFVEDNYKSDDYTFSFIIVLIILVLMLNKDE